MRLASLVALLFGCSGIGCSGGGYEVVRVAGGHTRPGRYVSSAAYQASLEASIAEAKGDWPQAVSGWSKARDEDPDGPELQAHLGVALCHVGKLQAGELAINDALRVDPDLEVGWTGRARCRLLASKPDHAAIRSDLEHALRADGDALEPALLFVHLELQQGHSREARARAEEAVAIHPQSASAWRALSEVAALEGDGRRAVIAASRSTSLDDAMGTKAKVDVLPAVDRAGVASDALSLRGSSLPFGTAGLAVEGAKGPCAKTFEAFVAITARAEPAAISIAADGLRASCPDLEAEVTRLEVSAIWAPRNAEEIEARALAAPSASARRWGARMRLRRRSVAELLAADALPRAEDRPTLALHLAASALRTQGKEANSLARAAHDLAPGEPTVARLCAELARRLGRDANDPLRRAACDLARTDVERAACKS